MNLKRSNGVTFLQSQGFVGIGIQGLHIIPPIKFFFPKAVSCTMCYPSNSNKMGRASSQAGFLILNFTEIGNRASLLRKERSTGDRYHGRITNSCIMKQLIVWKESIAAPSIVCVLVRTKVYQYYVENEGFSRVWRPQHDCSDN